MNLTKKSKYINDYKINWRLGKGSQKLLQFQKGGVSLKIITVLHFLSGVGSLQMITIDYIGEGGLKYENWLRNTWTAPKSSAKQAKYPWN